MDSRISIKGDFVINKPFIEVTYNPSDDARDDMVRDFAAKLESTSHWALIQWQPEFTGNSGRFSFRIYPMSLGEVENEIPYMQETIKIEKQRFPQPADPNSPKQ